LEGILSIAMMLGVFRKNLPGLAVIWVAGVISRPEGILSTPMMLGLFRKNLPGLALIWVAVYWAISRPEGILSNVL